MRWRIDEALIRAALDYNVFRPKRVVWAHTNPSLTQVAFRARKDNVALSSTTWDDPNQPTSTNLAQSTNWSQPVADKFRVRFEIQETAGASENVTFHLYYSHNGGTYTQVTSTSSVVRSVSSANYTDGDATGNQLTAGTGSFIAGVGDASDAVAPSAGNIAVPASGHTEVEFNLQLQTADLANNDTVALRAYRSTGALNAYSVTPTLTVVKANEVTMGPFTAGATAAATVAGASRNAVTGAVTAGATGAAAIAASYLNVQAVVLTSNLDTTAGTAYTTASVSMRNGMTYLLMVMPSNSAGGATEAPSSITGLGSGSWTSIGTPSIGGAIGVLAYHYVSTSDQSGTITINLASPGDDYESCGWAVLEVIGDDGAVPTNTNSGAIGSATSFSRTVTTPASGSMVIGLFEANLNETQTPTSPAVELLEHLDGAPNRAMTVIAEYPGDGTLESSSATAGARRAIIFEVERSAGGGAPIVLNFAATAAATIAASRYDGFTTAASSATGAVTVANPLRETFGGALASSSTGALTVADALRETFGGPSALSATGAATIAAMLRETFTGATTLTGVSAATLAGATRATFGGPLALASVGDIVVVFAGEVQAGPFLVSGTAAATIAAAARNAVAGPTAQSASSALTIADALRDARTSAAFASAGDLVIAAAARDALTSAAFSATGDVVIAAALRDALTSLDFSSAGSLTLAGAARDAVSGPLALSATSGLVVVISGAGEVFAGPFTMTAAGALTVAGSLRDAVAGPVALASVSASTVGAPLREAFVDALQASGIAAVAVTGATIDVSTTVGLAAVADLVLAAATKATTFGPIAISSASGLVVVDAEVVADLWAQTYGTPWSPSAGNAWPQDTSTEWG